MGVIVRAQIPDDTQPIGVPLVVDAGIGAARIGHRESRPLASEPPAG